MSNKTQLLSIVDDEHDIMCLFRDALSQIGDSNVLGFTDSYASIGTFQTKSVKLYFGFK